MIRVQDLIFSYRKGGFSLNMPSLQVEREEQIAFTGASGCGKTTLACLLAGINTPQQGTVCIDEFSIFELNEKERRNFRISNIGFVVQVFELFDYLTLEENILLPYLVNTSMPLTPEIKASACELAKSVGLHTRLNVRPTQLSQGEKQRIAICRALVTEPKILIADEPTGNLDPANTARVMDLIQNEVRKRNMTFLMVTHDHSLLERFDRVINVEALLTGEGGQ